MKHILAFVLLLSIGAPGYAFLLDSPEYYVPSDGTILAQNTFKGTITDVTLDATVDGSVIPGDVTVGSGFEGAFLLYDDPAYYDHSVHLVTEFTLFGQNDTYTFNILFGYAGDWGSVDSHDSNNVSAHWSNNFDSDGLENTFYTNGAYGSDYGQFGIDLNHIQSAAVSGSGFFGWEHVNVQFGIGPPTAVAEPSAFGLLALGATGVFMTRLRKRQA